MQIPVILDVNGQPTAPNNFIATQILSRYQSMIAQKEEKVKEYNKALEEIKESVNRQLVKVILKYLAKIN